MFYIVWLVSRGFQPEGAGCFVFATATASPTVTGAVFEAMHLPSLQVVRLPSWGGASLSNPL